jgi:hypothetical protein
VRAAGPTPSPLASPALSPSLSAPSPCSALDQPTRALSHRTDAPARSAACRPPPPRRLPRASARRTGRSRTRRSARWLGSRARRCRPRPRTPRTGSRAAGTRARSGMRAGCSRRLPARCQLRGSAARGRRRAFREHKVARDEPEGLAEAELRAVVSGVRGVRKRRLTVTNSAIATTLCDRCQSSFVSSRATRTRRACSS